MKGQFYFRCRECHASIINERKARNHKFKQAQLVARLNGELQHPTVSRRLKYNSVVRRKIEDFLDERRDRLALDY